MARAGRESKNNSLISGVGLGILPFSSGWAVLTLERLEGKQWPHRIGACSVQSGRTYHILPSDRRERKQGLR